MNVRISGFKRYSPGGFQNWTVTRGGGGWIEIPLFGQAIFYNQVTKAQVIRWVRSL